MTDTYSPVPELNLLKQFDNDCPDLYAQWGGMDDFGEMEFLQEDGLRRGLLGFALANGSGSLYALWKRDDRTDLASLPVVLLGDEGGIHLVARNVRDFLRLLGALEGDPACDWDDVYDRDEDELPAQADYHAWLKENFDLTPPEEAWDIILDAEQELGQAWAEWIHPILPDAVFSPIHELNQLKSFQDRSSKYTQVIGYRLVPVEQWKNWDGPSDLMPFAESHTGSDTLALWPCYAQRRLADQPVVMVGADSERHVIARDVPEFLTLLGALDGLKIHVTDTGVNLHTCDPSPWHAEYIAWLDNDLNLAPAPNAAGLIQAAQVEENREEEQSGPKMTSA